MRSPGLQSEVGQGIKILKPGERQRKEQPHQGERAVSLLEKDSARQEQVQGDGDRRGGCWFTKTLAVGFTCARIKMLLKVY